MSTYAYAHSSSRTLNAPMARHGGALGECCLSLNLPPSEREQLAGIIKPHRPLHKDEVLFRGGDPMGQIYAIRSGALKSYCLDSDGNEQITDFHLPGELLGLDAIGAECFRGYAVALSTSVVCTIALAPLEQLASRLPGLQQQLLNVLSRQIHYEHQHLNHSRASAEKRLAAFLLNLAARYNKAGLCARSFNLPMSRAEIANYLGLTGETISRLLSRYRRQGLIECRGRAIQLLNLAALQRIAAPLQAQDGTTVPPPERSRLSSSPRDPSV
jgi:CRP/FNR family transcriptional regulator